MRTLMQILGWIEHCERDHPGEGTIIPVWLCTMDAVNEAVAEGYIAQIGQQSLVPRLGMSTVIYGLTDKGRKEFYAGLPTAAPRRDPVTLGEMRT